MEWGMLILVALAGAAVMAVVPAFVSRWAVERVCEFRPPFGQVYRALLLGFVATMLWRYLVLWLREPYLEEAVGTALVLGWTASVMGGLMLVAASLGLLVRDDQGLRIGILPGAVVAGLTLVWMFPLALALWFIAAFYFLPGMGR